jgi:hypothetical protein
MIQALWYNPAYGRLQFPTSFSRPFPSQVHIHNRSQLNLSPAQSAQKLAGILFANTSTYSGLLKGPRNFSRGIRLRAAPHSAIMSDFIMYEDSEQRTENVSIYTLNLPTPVLTPVVESAIDHSHPTGGQDTTLSPSNENSSAQIVPPLPLLTAPVAPRMQCIDDFETTSHSSDDTAWLESDDSLHIHVEEALESQSSSAASDDDDATISNSSEQTNISPRSLKRERRVQSETSTPPSFLQTLFQFSDEPNLSRSPDHKRSADAATLALQSAIRDAPTCKRVWISLVEGTLRDEARKECENGAVPLGSTMNPELLPGILQTVEMALGIEGGFLYNDEGWREKGKRMMREEIEKFQGEKFERALRAETRRSCENDWTDFKDMFDHQMRSRVRYLRLKAETTLGIEPGFFASSEEWRVRSTMIVVEEVELFHEERNAVIDRTLRAQTHRACEDGDTNLLDDEKDNVRKVWDSTA